MSSRKKLMVCALGFVVLTTTLTVGQTIPPDIERVANRLSEADVERSGILRYSEPDYVREPQAPLVPGRAEARVESWRDSSNGRHTLVVLRTKNQTLPEPETWAVLLGDAWPKEHREFWLLSHRGEKARCVATADIANIPDSDPSWRVLKWSPDNEWVYLCKSTSASRYVYALRL